MAGPPKARLTSRRLRRAAMRGAGQIEPADGAIQGRVFLISANKPAGLWRLSAAPGPAGRPLPRPIMDLIRSALRSLRAHPLFSALVISLLALGIGANTAIFGVVNAVLLKPLPYPQPGDLVMVRKQAVGKAEALPGGGNFLPDIEFLGWTEAVPKSFRALAGYRNTTSTLQHGDGAVRVAAGFVTGEFFPMLGVTAWRGRLFGAEDVKPGAPMTAVLSYSAWQSRFNGADSALGEVVTIDDVPHTIIGVLPPAFEFTDPVQFWRPLQIRPNAPGQLSIQMTRVFGRLLPGTSLEIAQRELDAISKRFWESTQRGMMDGPMGGERRVMAAPGGGEQRVVAGPANGPAPAGGPAPGGERRVAAGGPGGGPGGPGGLPFANFTAQLVPLQEQLAQQSRTTLWLLLGAVGFVLLIACANIANLQLARAATRKRDSAIRAALGASPTRLALELLAENLVLALVGGALGIVLAWWGTKAMQVWLQDFLPRMTPVGVDFTVLGFGLLLAAVAGLAFGLAPAWQGSRVDLTETLKEGGHQSSAGGHRWRQGLVAFEIALALVLAINTGLLVKSIYKLYTADLGFRTSDVMTANLSLPRRYGTPGQQRDFAQRWLEAIRGLPGVKFAAVADAAPLTPYNQVMLVATAGGGAGGNRDASVNDAPRRTAIMSVSADFFRASGIALREGRYFAETDSAEAPKVAIVNEAYVKQYFPAGLPAGAQANLPFGGGPGGGGGGPGNNAPPTATIVGVVADVRPGGLDSAAQPLAYFPFTQNPRPRLSPVIQFTGDAATLSQAITKATHKLDAGLALDNPITLADQLARQNAPRRVTLLLTSAFAATAILLAAIGIFGVMSYTVTQRTQEIGVRMALGADQSTILAWMLRYGGVAIVAGLAVGLGLTLATGRLLKTFLVGITALDPAVIAAGVVGLGLVALLACFLPSLRATRVNPVEALRNE
ncbi:MAG: hypothetical protein C0518_12620 [Opitutus sp.]|nr:hypothetical protein [Opitutus sp.]